MQRLTRQKHAPVQLPKEHTGMRGRIEEQDSGEAHKISRGQFHENLATQTKKGIFYSTDKGSL